MYRKIKRKIKTNERREKAGEMQKRNTWKSRKSKKGKRALDCQA